MNHGIERAFATAAKFKKVMAKRGLLRAKAACPWCGNVTLFAECNAETLKTASVGRSVMPRRTRLRTFFRMFCTTEGCNAPGLIE